MSMGWPVSVEMLLLALGSALGQLASQGAGLWGGPTKWEVDLVGWVPPAPSLGLQMTAQGMASGYSDS
jgi:hypothetical protein